MSHCLSPKRCIYFYVCIMSVLLTFMFVYHIHIWCLWKPGEGIGFPGTGVKVGYKPPCVCWELNLGPLKEQVQLPTRLSPSLTGNILAYHMPFAFAACLYASLLDRFPIRLWIQICMTKKKIYAWFYYDSFPLLHPLFILPPTSFIHSSPASIHSFFLTSIHSSPTSIHSFPHLHSFFCTVPNTFFLMESNSQPFLSTLHQSLNSALSAVC